MMIVQKFPSPAGVRPDPGFVESPFVESPFVESPFVESAERDFSRKYLFPNLNFAMK